MALVEAYEEQYHGLVKSINEKLDRLSKISPASDRWTSTISGTRSDIEDAEEVLGKLEREIRSVKADAKAVIQTRAKQYRIDVGVCKETLETLTRKAMEKIPESEAKTLAANRDELFSGATNEQKINLTKSNDQRSRLVAATDRLGNTTDRLKDSRKICRETELVGADIMQDLRQQRETLLHSRDTIREVDENLGESRRILRVMSRRMAQNKRVMYGVAVVIVVIAVTLLVLHLRPQAPIPISDVPANSMTYTGSVSAPTSLSGPGAAASTAPDSGGGGAGGGGATNGTGGSAAVGGGGDSEGAVGAGQRRRRY